MNTKILQNNLMNIAPVVWLVWLVLLIGSSATAFAATTYYVSTSGNDSNPGTQAQPWKTIAKAAKTMVAGDTTIVNAGTYNETVNTVRSGTASNRITFRASGTVVTKTFFSIGHDYITIDGFDMDAGSYSGGFMMYISGSHCEILNNILHDRTAIGAGMIGIIDIESESSTGCLIKGNRYYASTGLGNDLSVIVVQGTNHIIENNEIGPAVDIDAFRVWGHDNIIRNNYVHDATLSSGSQAHMDIFQVFGWTGAESYNIIFEKNLIVNWPQQLCMTSTIGTTGIHDWDVRNNVFVNVRMQANIGIPNFRFYNNTCYNCGINGTIMYAYDDDQMSNFSGLRIRNNIFIYGGSINSYYAVMAIGSSGTDVVVSNNYSAKISGYGAFPDFDETNGINGGDPKFVNAGANDFHLQSNSPAINKGITLSSPNNLTVIDNDYEGNARPQGASWDVGAFEYTGGSGTTLLAPKALRVVP